MKTNKKTPKFKQSGAVVPTENKFQYPQLKAHLIITIIMWTLLIGLSFLWNRTTITSGVLQSARIEARVAIEKDIVYRRWNAMCKGVYVPITPETKPNPYLVDTLRDITTINGMHLTKINPAYMTRQVHEIGNDIHHMWGHITSLNPIRPENKADEWETDALTQFTQGVTEVSSAITWDKKEFMRLMRPLITEKSCLQCHAIQGYKLGEIRGGISVAVPMAPYLNFLKKTLFNISLFHFCVWGLGITAALVGKKVLERQMKYRLEKKEALGKEQKIQGRMEMAATVSHELNQPLQIITGNVELLLMDISKDSPHVKRLSTIKEQTRRMGDMTQKILTITQEETSPYPQGDVIRTKAE